MSPLRIVCMSDTHSLHGNIEVPDGDLLLHSGDFTNLGKEDEIASFGEFLDKLPHSEIVIVAGNHDFLFEQDPQRARELLGDVTYLQDEGATLHGLKIWGSPWQPEFQNWAFNLPRGAPLAEKWGLAPEDTDILVTHSPPMGILDHLHLGEDVGCDELRKALARIQPKLHVFGHIHESRGSQTEGSTLCVNSSICNRHYKLEHPPVVLDWDEGQLSVVVPA